jgi:anthranilate synthase/aminodeoxychorismate synthase-like glutamine amidotransferase
VILLIDNYDSFTFNLFQVVASLGHECRVVRNDAISLGEIERLKPDCIVISPGPGAPSEAGISLEAISRFAGSVPILGVCLGHQAIGQAFGGRVVRAPAPKHGKRSSLRHFGRGAYAGFPNPFVAARYHSLIIERATLPAELEITCETGDGMIMGVRHKTYAVEGVQFHPESIATEKGAGLLRRLLERSMLKGAS